MAPVHLLLACAAAGGEASTISLSYLTPAVDSARATSPPHPPTLSGRAPITATFSRAVIALGIDFAAGDLPRDLTPLLIHPNIEGTFRWVTTSVARFDPSHEWPAELEVSVHLNPQMRGYDGSSLWYDTRDAGWGVGQAGSSAPDSYGPPIRRFRTPALRMWAGRVLSQEASRVTNGRRLQPSPTSSMRWLAPEHLLVMSPPSMAAS
ncbi:MAG: hypothetical protein SGPRY_002129 [Prymnesium sp.]